MLRRKLSYNNGDEQSEAEDGDCSGERVPRRHQLLPVSKIIFRWQILERLNGTSTKQSLKLKSLAFEIGVLSRSSLAGSRMCRSSATQPLSPEQMSAQSCSITTAPSLGALY
jgi:hypothetical protein